MDKLRKAFVLD